MRFAPAVGLSVIALLGSSALIGAQAQSTRTSTSATNTIAFPRMSEAQTQYALIEDYCMGCHSGDAPVAGLSFDDLPADSMPQHAEVWEKVIRKLRGHMMPPVGNDRPSEAQSQAFIEWASAYLDFASMQAPDPGRVALHRLNRKEYGNAVRDILKVDVDPATILPADDTSEFDNIAEVLQVSPSFLDQYISAARTIAITATDPTVRPIQFRAEPGTNAGYHVEGLPLGTSGGFIDKHEIPADGEYDVALLAAPAEGERLIALVDGVVVYDSAKGTPEQQGLKVPPPAPAAPAAAPAAGRGGGRGPGVAPRRTVLRLPLTKGVHEIAAAFATRGSPAPTSIDVLGPVRASPAIGALAGQPNITGADVTGPVGYTGPALSPSRQAIFTCQPAANATAAQQSACAKEIFSRISRQAFRRPITDADLTAPMRFYDDGFQRAGFEAGVQQGLMAIIASPKFLYRTTDVPRNTPPGGVYAVSDIELASRLSFFIWSSVPDEELLKLAEQKKLNQPAVMEAQVARMLKDPRAEALVNNFAFQWLAMARLDTIEPDPGVFPEYSADLRPAFKEEMRLFLNSVLLQDKSVLELINADYTYMNERLAVHYGIEGVRGNGYQRVSLSADSPRRGILGKGAVLMATSYPNRTAPVLRGAWVLETVLGTPPDAPPPNAGALEDTPENAALGIRARMEHHRRSPSCITCHSLMDPLGLALDNFDAVGQWRTKDRVANNLPIDASGELPDGTKLGGPNQLREAIMARPEMFVESITEKLMVYAMGRRLEPKDMAAVREITEHAKDDGYRFSALVSHVAMSDQFRMSKAPDPTATPQRVATVGN